MVRTSVKKQTVLLVFISFTSCFGLFSPKMSEKIINGVQEDIYNYPYQVSVQYKNSHLCGGSIISNQHVLTAAHCVYLRPILKLSANLGGSYHNAPYKQVRIYKYKVHDNYNTSTYDNDIAILLLVSKIIFGPNILPISLPNQNEILHEGSLGAVSGWGQTIETIKLLPFKLRAIKIPTISNVLCQSLNYPNIVTENMICAKDLNGNKDACQGDSGSGFVSKGKLFGITSWGIGCGRVNKAGVYTNVAKYRNWIKMYTDV